MNKARPIAPEHKSQILEKFLKYIAREYLILDDKEMIKSLIDYFAVAKGNSDIRVVLNGTSCGLNHATWSANFWLPNANTIVRLLSFGYRMVDIDIGEMFLNFPLHKILRSYSGVDLSCFREQLLKEFPSLRSRYKGKRILAYWTRLWFGSRQSPEYSTIYYYLIEEFIRGHHEELDNPLRWDHIILNLVGSSDWDPRLPNVYKWDWHTWTI